MMRRFIAISFFALLAASCIPLRVAPEISDYRLVRGKKFNRKLPQREMFIFQDPKEANAFYNYVDSRYGLNHQSVYDDVPFLMDGNQFFFSVYEVEITDKSLNLFPTVFDLFVGGSLGWEEPILSDDWDVVNKRDNWYVAIEVYSDFEKDCLTSKSPYRMSAIHYLTTLKNEYISNANINFGETQEKN